MQDAIMPLVSVVTPFYNSERYLEECIQSVLAQTYSNFEYILMDNCSTDKSGEIAEAYARRDRRVRIARSSQFVGQIPNYNRAVALISSESKYCKIVEADNHVFPECLELMVNAFEQSVSIGLVSSYWLMGDTLYGSGYPYPMTMVPGRTWAAQHLRSVAYVFGAPTQVMYRSAIIREHTPFFNEGVLHADTDKCLRILERWDFGFVHQVLSFSRIDNESISSTTRDLEDVALDHYIIEQRFAPIFLEPAEIPTFIRASRRRYYHRLARHVVRLGGVGSAFWQYQIAGLKSLGEKLNWPYLVLALAWEFVWLALNPGVTTKKATGYWKKSQTAIESSAPQVKGLGRRHLSDRMG
jgi:glycosyltransferase involved in cell wall biosynthesis